MYLCSSVWTESVKNSSAFRISFRFYYSPRRVPSTGLAGSTQSRAEGGPRGERALFLGVSTAGLIVFTCCMDYGSWIMGIDMTTWLRRRDKTHGGGRCGWRDLLAKQRHGPLFLNFFGHRGHAWCCTEIVAWRSLYIMLYYIILNVLHY